MQLYVLGPAFGLPSIDAECNAAVAVLQLYSVRDCEIVPACDTQSPLPRLVDGTAQVDGFSNILRHLSRTRICPAEAALDQTQRADCTALSCFIESRAPPLLDISLYVDCENYRRATRPAFSRILPWHANCLLPPRRRAAARRRTDHLGISSVDVDDVHPDVSARPGGFDRRGKQAHFEAETQQRVGLLLPRRETVRSLLQRGEHAAVFKLNALADNFLAPLQDLLGEKPYLAGHEPTAVDCLAYGYLSLMLYPQVPQEWLSASLKRKYRKLVAFTVGIHSRLALATQVDHVLSLSRCATREALLAQRTALGMALPWTAPHRPAAHQSLKRLCAGLWAQIPYVGDADRLQLWGANQPPLLHGKLPLILLSASLLLVSTGYLYRGILIWPRGDPVHIFGRRRLADFGHLGAALAGISLIGQQG